jgi:oxygen-independent coproporphyrinogen III oxidase
MAGIYIHIPFCKKICFYCDFYRVISPESKSSFTGALLKESELRKDYLTDEVISTIYLGGGTPSVLSVKELQTILDNIYKNYKIEDNCEITIELNPDDVSPDYLESIKKLNINRISLGIQSWRDEDLKLLNRRHDSAQAKKALEDTLNAGFKNVTIDLIYGIPGMSLTDWAANLEKSLTVDIKHISAYHLTIEPGTVFGKMKKEGHLIEIEEEESTSQFNILIEKAESAGFIHYEISNFGKEGFFSRHNTNYWKQANYLGLGPSAHSFNNYSRQWNICDIKKYIYAINNDKPYFEKEELGVKTRFNEYIMTSLRTMWGIDLDFVERSFEKEGYDYIVNMAGKFKNYGLMRQDKKNLILTNQGIMISDNIISEFMMVEDD